MNADASMIQCRSFGRGHHNFRISEHGISIIGISAVGGGILKWSDEDKFDLVAKEATARDIFTMRTFGFVAVADRVRLIQRSIDLRHRPCHGSVDALLAGSPSPGVSGWFRWTRFGCLSDVAYINGYCGNL